MTGGNWSPESMLISVGVGGGESEGGEGVTKLMSQSTSGVLLYLQLHSKHTHYRVSFRKEAKEGKKLLFQELNPVHSLHPLKTGCIPWNAHCNRSDVNLQCTSRALFQMKSLRTVHAKIREERMMTSISTKLHQNKWEGDLS